MADIKVILVDQYESKRELAEVPDNVEIKSLLPLILDQLELPESDGSGQLSYKLIHKESSQQLQEVDTLKDAGVVDGDTLRVVTEITAG